MDKTKEIVDAMLKENTGRHFLDSGDFYGRHWEENQDKDFENEPEATVEFNYWEHSRVDKNWEALFTINTYHFLTRACIYNERLDDIFHWWANKEEHSRDNWLQCAKKFPEYLKRMGVNVTGLYGDEQDFWNAEYTYNCENALSQDIQYVYFEIRDGRHYGDSYAIVQSHNGCDSRGGMSTPRVFEVSVDEYAIWDYARGVLYVDGNFGVHWDTYDAGYHWDSNWWKGSKDPEHDNLHNYDGTDDPELRGKGVIYIDEEHNGYCPVTGGKIEAAIF